MLAVLYVANDAGFADASNPGHPQTGDAVSWPGGGSAAPASGLTFGTNAFDSIEAAIAAATDGDAIEIAPATYTEGDVVIDKSLTLQGNGAVALQSPTYGSGTGITIIGNPQTVTIGDLSINAFHSSLQSSGGGTLNLVDLTLDQIASLPTGEPLPLTVSSVSNVNDLNLRTTTTLPRLDVIGSGNWFGADASLRFFDGNDSLTITHVANLSYSTGAGSDSFEVTPLASTNITIDGGDPAPPTKPGDTLTMELTGVAGARLTVAQDAAGFSGNWEFADAKPVSFSDIETISPAATVANGVSQTLSATEGVSTGSQVVATFTNPGNLPPADYSAEINWGDGTTSTGTVSLDASSSTYSVSGNHAYAEDGSDQITVTVRSAAAPDATFHATATVVEPPLVRLFPPVSSPLGYEGTPLTVNVGYFTHGANTESGTPPPGAEGAFVGELSATIEWGDGATSAGRVINDGSSYVVSGTHVYHDEGSYSVKATVLDISGGNTLSLGTLVAIREALLPDGTNGTAELRLISEAYGDLLHRAVEAAGLAYRSAQLDSGAPRAQIVAGIENSDEYRRDVIDAIFEKYLHRHAEADASSYFGSLQAHGASDEQIAAMIVGSNEYFTAGDGTNDGFLNSLFEDALDRPIDPAAKAAFAQFLARGMTREQAATMVFDGAEYRENLVARMYRDLLDRPVDASSEIFWAAKLADGWTDEQMLAAVIASDEYFAKTS